MWRSNMLSAEEEEEGRRRRAYSCTMEGVASLEEEEALL